MDNGMNYLLNGGVEVPSLRFNSSCDAPESSKQCEKGCGKNVQDCFVACSDQEKSWKNTKLNRGRVWISNYSDSFVKSRFPFSTLWQRVKTNANESFSFVSTVCDISLEVKFFCVLKLYLACPCHADCPLGCAECDNVVCIGKCDNIEENPDFAEVCLGFLIEWQV